MELGAEVNIATTDDDGPGERVNVPLEKFVPGPAGAPTIYFPKSTETYKTSWSMARWLRRHVSDYDVIHIHALFSFSSFAAARAARKAGVPYIVRPLGVLNRWSLENRKRLIKQWSLAAIELPILRGAAAIHYTAEAEKSEAAEAHPHIAKMRSVIIPIPVEPAAAAVDSTTAHRTPDDRRVILFLSRLHAKKGPELLLQAFQEVRAEFPDVVLIMAGNGDENYVARLREQARMLGCDDGIEWAGFVTGADKAALLARATIFVLPSYSENFGIAAAEAMAAGVPSILSEGIAIAPGASREQAALLVSPEPKVIAVAIRRLLTDGALRQSLGERGREYINNHFSPKAVGAQLMKLYQSVIGKSETSCAT